MSIITVKDLLERANERKVLVDFLFFSVLIALCLWRFGGAPRIFGVLVFLITFIFVYNEVTVQQFIQERKFDEGRKEYILQNTSTNIQLPSALRIGLHVPFIISGIVQMINYIRGDKTYKLTRELGTSLISQAPKTLIYRVISDPMPRKAIYLVQHVGAVLDNLTFLQFIPEGFAFRVLNNSRANPIGLFPKTSRKNLFGAHFIDPENPETLKQSISAFVEYMIRDSEPTIYCIWPSGKLWNGKLENGIEGFKLGAFYMSCFTGIPVCIVHTKFDGFVSKMIVEQSPLYSPPQINFLEGDYVSFYENPNHRPLVSDFKDKVERKYRIIDDQLWGELHQI